MRESWFANIASTRTVGDIAHLSGDDNVLPIIQHGQGAANTRETLGCRSWYNVNDDQTQKTFHTSLENLSDVSGPIEPSGYTSEEDSFYSMDSADQDAHPLLLSMPIIPQIKLERKATVRKSDPESLLDAPQNQSFLSPRIRDFKTIRDFRTPAKTSSRRYGCILPRTRLVAVLTGGTQARSHGRGAVIIETSRRSGTEPQSMCSVSEPILKAGCLSDDEKEPLLKEEISESPHSDVLLSMIDDVGSSPGPSGESTPHKHPKRGHQRSSLAHSVSLSSIIQAVADGCASLKPKLKPKSTTKLDHSQRVSNVHNTTSKWASKDGQIVIKVFVPSTDDIWMFRVPQDVNLVDFTSRVVRKLGFSVSFSGSLWDGARYYFRTDKQFEVWVKGRVRFGRNLPIVAHIPAPLPLVRLSVDEGCEVWCCA